MFGGATFRLSECCHPIPSVGDDPPNSHAQALFCGFSLLRTDAAGCLLTVHKPACISKTSRPLLRKRGSGVLWEAKPRSLHSWLGKPPRVILRTPQAAPRPVARARSMLVTFAGGKPGAWIRQLGVAPKGHTQKVSFGVKQADKIVRTHRPSRPKRHPRFR